MTIPELLDTLIIHPNGMIELPLDIYETLVEEVPSNHVDCCDYRGDWEKIDANFVQCPICNWVSLAPGYTWEDPETNDLLIQEGY